MIVNRSDRHKKAVAEHFSRNSLFWRTVYDDRQNTTEKFYDLQMRDRKDAVLRILDDYAGSRSLNILDLGCGAGIYMKEVLIRGHTVTGVDISEQMLKEARETTANYNSGRSICIQGDIENLQFADDSFDVVICVGVLQFLTEDIKGISEMSRVMKTGGIIILTLPNILKMSNFLDPYYYLIRMPKYIFYKTMKKGNNNIKSKSIHDFSSNDRFVNRRYVYKQLSGTFSSNNLKKIAEVSLGFGPLTFWRKEFLPSTISIKISHLLEKLTREKHMFLLNFVANQWVICIQKIK